MHSIRGVPAVLSLGALLACPLQVQAADTNLKNFAGLSEVQQPVAGVVQTACVGLRARRNAGVTPTTPAPSVLPPEQEKLFQSCARMVQTANQLTPGNTEATTLSLGLSSQQLATAVQAIAPEEASTQGRTAVEAPGSNPVGLRLFSLRAGSRGFGLSAAGPRGTVLRTALAPALGDSGGGAAAEASGRLSGFLNLNYNSGNKTTTAREDGFDFDNSGGTLGVDYRFSDNFVAGVALSISKTDADLVAGLGTADSKNRAVLLYGSWYVDKAYVDMQLGFSRNDYDTTRRIVVASTTAISGFDTVAFGSTRGDQTTAVIGAGYDISSGAWLLTPYGRLGYLKLDINGYTETESRHGLALDVAAQSLKSLQTALGVKVAYNAGTAAGVVVPYASIEWNREFANDTRSLTAKYTNDPNNNFFAIPTDDPDRNYVTLSAGASMLFRRGLSAFLNFTVVEGLRHIRNRGIAIGARMEF